MSDFQQLFHASNIIILPNSQNKNTFLTIDKIYNFTKKIQITNSLHHFYSLDLNQQMQQLTHHFNKKKVDFVNFFSNMIQVIQKLAYDIQIEIGREYHQIVAEFRDLNAENVTNLCVRMEQERGKVYHEMIDRLYVILKNFANQVGGNNGVILQTQNFKSQQIARQSQEKKNFLNTVLFSELEKIPSEPIDKTRSNSRFNNSSQIIQLNQQQNPAKSPLMQPSINLSPSPFAQKQKQNLLKQSQISNIQSPSTQRTKQKIQIMKKTDVCQSLDNYLNKEAKEMLQRSQSRHNSSYSSLRRSQTRKYDTPQRGKYYQNYEGLGMNIDRRIEEKIGGVNNSNGKFSTSEINRKFAAESMVISPIQRYKLE